MVMAELLEGQLCAYLDGFSLPPDYLQRALDFYTDRSGDGEKEEARRRLNGEMERWRRLYVLGDINESRYLGEVSPLKNELSGLSVITETPDQERAAGYLQEIGVLFAKSSIELKRRFLVEVMDEVGVEGNWIRYIKPRPQYAALFSLDRAERFGVDRCFWLPGQDSNLQPSG